MVENEEGVERKKHFSIKILKRNSFSERQIVSFGQTFLENVLKDPISGEVGKSIIFCISQKHASKNHANAQPNGEPAFARQIQF